MSYLTEFPEFASETLPAIPADWIDESWHNDTCPSWRMPNGFKVFVDYADSTLRELSLLRFVVIDDQRDEPRDVLLTDDWNEVLNLLTDKESRK